MLTMDARKRSTSYQFANQMVNVGWIAGWLERNPANRREILVHQGSKKEFAVPVEIREGETVRPGYKDGSPIKVTCRISGKFLREQGERIAVLRMLDMDNPTVLDMQPYERRRSASASNGHDNDEHAAPAEAPAPKPKTHRVLLPEGIKARLSPSSNFFRIAGYVGGVVVEPGKLRDDGRPGEPCLVILLRQDDNPDNAIPVRCYNRLAEAIASKLPIGLPIIINDGEIKIRVVPTGEPAGADGIVPVHRYPYIKARVPKVASTDHILNQPKWAEELTAEFLRRRHRSTVKVANGANGSSGAGDSATANGNGHATAEVVVEAAATAAEAAPASAVAAKRTSKSLSAIAPE